MAPNNTQNGSAGVLRRGRPQDDGSWPEFTMNEVAEHHEVNDMWVCIEGRVYDVTTWADDHPGGKLALLGLAGRDATDSFRGFHPQNYREVRLRRFQVGVVKDYVEDEVQAELNRIRQELTRQGMYDTHYSFYVKHVLFELALLLTSFYTLQIANHSNPSHWSTLGWYSLSAALIGMFWQQLAFIGHDAGHNSISHVRDTDWLGSIFVTVGFGVSGQWWKRNHNFHHLVTNSIDWDPDIQHLPVLAVTHKAFVGYFSKYYERVMNFDAVARFIVSYQHYLYYIVMGVARWNLYVQSLLLLLNPFKKVRGRFIELGSIAGFWVWFIITMRTIPSTGYMVYWLLVSHAFAGIIHVQITLSHFAMETYMGRTYLKDDLRHFVRMQLATSMNVDCHPWMDWFHGGLQFQVEHHLLPRLPRQNLRYAMENYIRPMAKKYGLPYHIYSFVECNKMVIGALRDAAMEARKHPNSGKVRNYLKPFINAEG